jgi:tetratricopeptide (TPR) repeat protein
MSQNESSGGMIKNMKLQLPTLIAVCLAILLIGSIYFFLGDKSELGIAVNLESEEFKQIRTHATDAFNAGQYQQAIELYSQAMKMRPENAEIFNDLGAVYYKQGLKYAGPKWPSWEKELIDEGPDAAVAALKVAIDKTISGVITFKTRDEAVADAIEKEAKQRGGQVYRQRWENEITINILIGETKTYLLRARDHYLYALDLKPTHSVAYRNLGSFFMKVGKTDTALDYFQEAYKLDPRDKELEEYLNQFRK